jgi:hypothetical protein
LAFLDLCFESIKLYNILLNFSFFFIFQCVNIKLFFQLSCQVSYRVIFLRFFSFLRAFRDNGQISGFNRLINIDLFIRATGGCFINEILNISVLLLRLRLQLNFNVFNEGFHVSSVLNCLKLLKFFEVCLSLLDNLFKSFLLWRVCNHSGDWDTHFDLSCVLDSPLYCCFEAG